MTDLADLEDHEKHIENKKGFKADEEFQKNLEANAFRLPSEPPADFLAAQEEDAQNPDTP